MSIAGGYYKAVERAVAASCDCLQIFTKNNSQWRAKTITDEDVELFRQALAGSNIRHTLSHASYLINLASPDEELWKKSVEAMVVELRRAEQLGIPAVVVHPGAYIEGGKDARNDVGDLDFNDGELAGLERIVRALDSIERRTARLGCQCLLENTAGQGTNLGWQFEQLGWILGRLRRPDRVGVCIDTCHAFAAGYAMDQRRDYLATVRRLDRTVGLDRIRAFHLNDSKRECASRVDRHENIGHGMMGTEPFRHLLTDRRFGSTPMYLETPKGDHDGEAWDRINLRVLRQLSEAKQPRERAANQRQRSSSGKKKKGRQ